MDISSISLTNMFSSSPVERVALDPVADVVDVDVSRVVAIGAVEDKDATKVEGTAVVTIGMTVAGASSRLACLSYIKLSISFSISLN